MKLSELRQYYNFEEQKNLQRSLCSEGLNNLVHVLEDGTFVGTNIQKAEIMQFIEGYRKILADDRLLEKATILNAMCQMKEALSSFCSVSDSKIYSPKFKVYLFGQELEFDQEMQSLHPEDFRKILFETVGLEFIPLHAVYSAIASYNYAARRYSAKEVDYSFVYNKETKLKEISKRSLVSCRRDWAVDNCVDMMSYGIPIGIGFDSLYYPPMAVVNYPEEYLPQRVDSRKK